MMVFVVQGTSTGMIDALLGVVLDALLANQLNDLMLIAGVLLNSATLPVAIEPLQVTVIMLVAMATMLLSTPHSSRYAAAIQPTEALRYG